MPDAPTTKAVNFYAWVAWREQQPRRRSSHRPAVDEHVAMAELRAMADELYALALKGVAEITGTRLFVPGLLSETGPTVPRAELESLRLDLIPRVERHGAELRRVFD